MHHLLRRAGYVTNLDHATVSFMERGFMEDFRTVTLSVQRGTDCFRRPIACTIGERIFISEKWYRPDTWLGKHILAHELAHVVQKRRGIALRPRARLAPHESHLVEAEAHAAAALVSCGRQFACSVADQPDRPRCWGPAGHYYTAYFILLAAGVEDSTAFRMAFFAQMADQVDELDASEAGKRMAIAPVGPFITRARAGEDAAIIWARERKKVQLDLEVQMGLHCLTGGNAAKETYRRRQTLDQADWGSFEFGLAIHPYGDSFAHRQKDYPKQMYPHGMGHLLEIAYLRNPHCPDFLNQRQAIYYDYAESLYEIVCDQTSFIQYRPLPRLSLRIPLSEVAGEDGDDAQIQKIRGLAVKLLGKELKDYRPEKEELAAWTDFQKTHLDVCGGIALDDALRFAKLWQAPCPE